MKNLQLKIFLFAFLLTAGLSMNAQDDAATLRNLLSNDTSSTQILLNYPDSIRKAALIASAYPQTFTKISDIQKTSSSNFKNLLSGYSQGKQKQLWDIARYPELTSLLIANKDKSKNELILY